MLIFSMNAQQSKKNKHSETKKALTYAYFLNECSAIKEK